MGARHGFSTVPKWRSKGVLGIALAAALLAETFVVTSEAYAAPDAPAGEEADPTRGPNGLEAPDIASAQTIARLEGERVEVVGERTETSSTWALPDGSMSTGLASGPIWVRQGDGDGSTSADWAAVDLTLERGDDGTVRPKAHPADLVLAGEGQPEGDRLLSMQREDGESLALEWSGSLPEPRLEGPRAVYSEVQPGVDLVIEATRTGYEQFFVLTERPSGADAPELSLRVRAEGLEVEAAAEGGLVYTDAGGDTVASSGTPLVWDAGVDAERLHPVTEPWTGDGDADTALAPQPDWGAPSEDDPQDPPAGPRAAPAPIGGGTSALPVSATGPVGEELGQPASPLATEAGASPGLPLESAAQVTAPGVAELELLPDAEFLQDPATTYPVVVDPEQSWTGWFDTWVQHGYTTDQSASTELRLGTFDGGTSVARSFINLDVTGLRYKTIQAASLSLWEWHAYSCAPRNWEVWATGQAGTGTRINAQPTWGPRWSVSSQTTGHTNCAQNWVSTDIRNLVQAWADGGYTQVAMGLKAENEADNAAWKKFNSANAAAGLPTLYVKWNTPPNAATALSVSPSVNNGAGGGLWTNDVTPRLVATASDPDAGNQVDLWFYLRDIATGAQIWYGSASKVTAGQAGFVDVPAGVLSSGKSYRFQVFSHDGVEWGAAPTAWTDFTVEATAPAAPSVSSTDYPADAEWHKEANQAGAFTLALPAADPTVVRYEWGLDKTPTTQHTALTTPISVTPTTNGRHVLQVRAVDKAGSPSPTVSYVFYVGRGGLTSPIEGSQVVRRVRLTVEAETALTHVKFQWRRGPDAATFQDVAHEVLSGADGEGFDDPWTSLAEIGDYATWDAGLTLGHVPGPVQVRALLATDAAGTGEYQAPWVTVTVSPDAQYAATDDVGPGSVNLLTGDYTLSSTDVDEFGLSLGRSASSRDPRAGLEPQAEQLSSAQQTMGVISGYAPSGATLVRVTDRGHSAGPPLDALRTAPTGTTPDSFTWVPQPADLAPGGTYRITAWVYVPAATGLNPDHATRGQRIAAYWSAGGAIHWAMSEPPTRTDMWQQLSLDITVPAGATWGGRVRLYNGMSATGKYVYYDDVSIREIWSPLGPQWSLGTADEIAGTAYSHISLPYPDVAQVHLSGGGEIWFTGATGNTVWWPQPGAESLTLAKNGDGSWTLTELNGTVSTFAKQTGASTFQLVTTSPPAAAGQTRLLYETVNGRVRLARMIAPVEPGVDPTAAEGTACTQNPASTPLPVGCRVVQLVYATTTTATGTTPGTYGTFTERLSEVKLWSAESPTATQADAVVAVKYRYDIDGRLREVWDPRIPEPLTTRYAYDTDGRVIELAPPGEFAWQFRYGTGGAHSEVGTGDLVDRSSGRLYSVSRASLVPGTIDQAGPDTTSTIVYAVPLTRAGGGPHDLDTDALATWAQTSAPTDATAIFGPEDVPGLTTATPTSPGPDGYRPATVHYLDSSGREVNTATPSGPEPVSYIDTAEYDQYGNIVRELSASNRLLALGQGPTAGDDLDALNLTASDTATRADALSTFHTYQHEGVDLVQTRGPLVRLAVGNDPENVQRGHDLTTYVYDEGKPDGAAYHLATTQTDAFLVPSLNGEELLDVVVRQNRYDPIDGASPAGPTSGWINREPTTVVADAGDGGARITALLRYDAQGRVVESRPSDSNGADAATHRTTYYTAGPNPDRPECGDKPAYAGLPCTTYTAGDVTGHDPTRMGSRLPETFISAYDRYGSAESVQEASTGLMDGAMVAQSRVTITEYDLAGRVTAISVSSNNAGTAVAASVRSYDEATGRLTSVSSQSPGAGNPLVTVAKTFDRLGRLTRYEDGNGGWTAGTYNPVGKLVEFTNSIGVSTVLNYDAVEEPRGYVTSVHDSVAGTISATYGPDGQLETQTLPGNVVLNVAYDSNQLPIRRMYVRASDDSEIATSNVVENHAGQWITHDTPASKKRYAYDRLRRLTDVQDVTAGINTCTWRRYAYNNRSARTSLNTSVSDASCADPADPVSLPSTNTYSYDSADRLVGETALPPNAWVYDPLGRITRAPLRGNSGGQVINTYFANDLIASQSIEGIARQSWTLDPIGRFATYASEAWVDEQWQDGVTKVNHYSGDDDSPSWIVEDASQPDVVTRYVRGLDGSLALQTGKSGGRVLQLIDLHGDVMTTVPIADGANTADWSGLAHRAAEEFGSPTDLTSGDALETGGLAPAAANRYGWLGMPQRSTDALAGVTLMGARLYDSATGRFWSPDPIPGGNATSYDYCSADPVNCVDLDGRWSLIKALLSLVSRYTKKAATRVAVWRPRISPQPTVVLARDEMGGAGGGAGGAGGAFPMPRGGNVGAPRIPAGSAGGPTAGQRFSQPLIQAERGNVCAYCRMYTERPHLDHRIPRSLGGNATADNAVTACRWCNLSKGPRPWPVNPPPGYQGEWPPAHWNFGGL